MPFKKQKLFDQHNLEKHGITPLYKCTDCSYAGPSQISLNRHVCNKQANGNSIFKIIKTFLTLKLIHYELTEFVFFH